ncbi:MAG TPA: ATP-binding protein, partial [Chromatiales bacterium]|nr:ATP-binding protein [Chromatiales bacterium]
AAVRQRVSRARARQLTRAGKPNAALRNPEVDQWCALQPEDRQLLSRAIEYLGLSARAYHRVLKVARTIADLTGDAEIRTTHLTEAIGYRRLDRAPRAPWGQA